MKKLGRFVAQRICSVTWSTNMLTTHCTHRLGFDSTDVFRCKRRVSTPMKHIPFDSFSRAQGAISKFPSLPSQLCKCHCCTSQNGAIFGKFPNWAFSALASRHGAITFAAQCQTGKNACKSGRMPEGCEEYVRPFCLRSASLPPPFCLRYGND